MGGFLFGPAYSSAGTGGGVECKSDDDFNHLDLSGTLELMTAIHYCISNSSEFLGACFVDRDVHTTMQVGAQVLDSYLGKFEHWILSMASFE